MATVFKWSVVRMSCLPQEGGQQDVVVQAQWICNGTDTTYTPAVSCNRYGQNQFLYTPGSAFTPYDQLTEQQVLDWCWASGTDKSAVEAAVAAQVAEAIRERTPVVVTPPLPWAAK